MQALKGIIPPIITPYTVDGDLNEPALIELIEWYADAGCHGLWVCGGTGEGVTLTLDERLRMINLVAERVGGRMKVAFHVGAVSTSEAVAAARASAAAGVDAISSVPPFFYGKSQAEILNYFSRLADASDLPLYIYNLPDAVGYSLSVNTILKIAEQIPNVVGMKHSATNLDLVVEVLRGRPDFQMIVGRGELTLAGLVLGARGVVCASLCMAPERFVSVWRAFEEGKICEAMSHQQQATRVKELFTRFPVIASTKRINSMQIGIDCGPPREPLAAIAGEDEPALVAMGQELGLLNGDPLVASLGEAASRPAAPR